MTGTAFIYGDGTCAGKTMNVWVQNETHLATTDSSPAVMNQDMIHIVSSESGEPFTNTRLSADSAVTVIATPIHGIFLKNVSQLWGKLILPCFILQAF